MFKDSLKMFEMGVLNEWRHWQEPTNLPPPSEWYTRSCLNTPPKIFGMWRDRRDRKDKPTGKWYKVLNGVITESGSVVIEWCIPSFHTSIVIFKSFTAFTETHILNHPLNKTRLLWRDYRGLWHDAYHEQFEPKNKDDKFGIKLKEWLDTEKLRPPMEHARDVIPKEWLKIWKPQ